MPSKANKEVVPPGKSDPVNPSHYKDGWSNGAELIDITENLNFNRGNAVKYIARAGIKNPDSELEDLRKAQWYITRELERLMTFGVLTNEEVDYYFSKIDLSKREPRVFYYLAYAPRGVYVAKDANGDTWRSFYGGKQWKRDKDGKDSRKVEWNGPFTEVLGA